MEQTPLFSSIDRTPREKNLIALLILAAGLIIGSLFVDVAQLFTGAGFSGKAVREHNLLEAGGKTWVAYTDPLVTLRVVTEEACTACSPDEALVWLRRIVPTIDAIKVEASSAEGQKLIADFGLRTLPSFVFSQSIDQTDFFNEAVPLFEQKQGDYVFDMNKIGLPVGKYLTAPAIEEDDIKMGNKEAPVQFIVFSDFECQFCKVYHAEYKKVLAEYGERVLFVYKHFPLPSHPQAERAGQAAQCAFDQNKFWEYSDILFDKQAEWGKSKGLQAFKNYSYRVKGLNGRAFAECLDSGKHAATLSTDMEQAQEFNLAATPTTFITSATTTEFVSGAATQGDLKPLIEKALGN